MNAIDIVKTYFKASNQSDFSKIWDFFTDSSTYSSQNTGLYIGREDIIDMQKIFHTSFEKLHWQIVNIVEEKENIVRAEFDFNGVKNGEQISFSGVEYIVVFDGKIQHIEIRNK